MRLKKNLDVLIKKKVYVTRCLLAVVDQPEDHTKYCKINWDDYWYFSNSNLEFIFLAACTRLYKPLCRSVGQSVAGSKNELNLCDKTIWAMETISNDSASACYRVYSIVTAPAQQHATKPSMYTALFPRSHITGNHQFA